MGQTLSVLQKGKLPQAEHSVVPMESNPLSRAHSTLVLPLIGPRGATARWEAEDEKRKPFPMRYRESGRMR